jgi:hypothetical protein
MRSPLQAKRSITFVGQPGPPLLTPHYLHHGVLVVVLASECVPLADGAKQDRWLLQFGVQTRVPWRKRKRPWRRWATWSVPLSDWVVRAGAGS